MSAASYRLFSRYEPTLPKPMNSRKTLLFAALGIAVTALVYYTIPRGSGPVGGAGENKGSSSALAAGDAAARHNVGGVTRPADSEAGENPSQPPPSTRKAGELTDELQGKVAAYEGKPLVATVRVDARWTPELAPNQVGEFPAVYVKRGQKVSIRLRFPEAEPGARAGVSVEDGGFVGDHKAAVPLVLDGKREGEFDFTTGAAEGRYRVVVRQGADTRILVLWAEAS